MKKEKLFDIVLNEGFFSRIRSSSKESIEAGARKIFKTFVIFDSQFFERVDGEICYMSTASGKAVPLHDWISKKYEKGTFLKDIGKRFEADGMSSEFSLKEYSYKIWERVEELFTEWFESFEKRKKGTLKEALTFEDTIRTVMHIESEDDLGDTSFTYYLDADIGDTVFICEDADVYMREDKKGWAIYWHNSLMDKIDASDEDDKEIYIKKYRQAQQKYKNVCNKSLDGTLERECLSGDENGQPSFDYSNASEVFKHFGESKKPTTEKSLRESINEGDKFENENGTIIEILEYDEDDDYVLYKVNDKFYDTHIDSIEVILSENGYKKLNESKIFKRILNETTEDYEEQGWDAYFSGVLNCPIKHPEWAYEAWKRGWKKAEVYDIQKNSSYSVNKKENGKLSEARVFSHSSGFGLLKPSWHYDYEEPKEEPLYLATETNEDDGEMYFDEKGNSSKFEADAKKFTSEEEALEFAKKNAVFGEPGTKLLENNNLDKNKKSKFRKENKMATKLNEKRIELNRPYPVKKDEVIDIVERSNRLVHKVTDGKTIQLYIYSNGSDSPEAFAEVEITSVGYILHGAEGYGYQGNSLKEFEEDLNDVVFHYDNVMSKRLGESTLLKENILNESTENHKCLTVKEFYEKLKHINFDDEYDYTNVHYAGNYSGLVRNIYIEDNKLVLSAKFEKGGDFNIGFFDIYDAIRDFTEDRNTCDYDVVYNVPSMGTYAVLGVEKNHYEYEDDVPYDACDIYCSDERI